MYPIRLFIDVRTLLDVRSDVECFTGYQVNTERHVAFFCANATEVNRHSVNEIVHHRSEVNQITKEERKRFNAIALIEGRQFKACGIHGAWVGDGDVCWQWIDRNAAIHSFESVNIVCFILEDDVEWSRLSTGHLDSRVPFRPRRPGVKRREALDACDL